jgi:queuosine precursor transporter
MNQLKDTAEGERYSGWFVLIVAVFVSCLITANITAVKLINLFGLILPAAILVFPLSYITGDVLTEVYGYSRARRVIWLGFFCNFVVVLFVWIGQILPPAVFWDGQAAYVRILGYTPRLLVASFLAYLVGEFANAFVLAKMKIATRGRWLWLRTIGSTLVGQGLDSAIFITLAFAGAIPAKGLVIAIITQWLAKSIYEALATPLTYAAVNFLKRKEGMDVYDLRTKFNPLVILK